MRRPRGLRCAANEIFHQRIRRHGDSWNVGWISEPTFEYRDNSTRSRPDRVDVITINGSPFADQWKRLAVTKVLPCLIDIMATASQFKIIARRRAALRVRHDVMEFEKAGLPTAPLFASKGTSAAIAAPHFALDGGGNVSRAEFRFAPGLSRPIGRSNLSFQQIFKQQCERAVEYRSRIARRNVDAWRHSAHWQYGETRCSQKAVKIFLDAPPTPISLSSRESVSSSPHPVVRGCHAIFEGVLRSTREFALGLDRAAWEGKQGMTCVQARLVTRFSALCDWNRARARLTDHICLIRFRIDYLASAESDCSMSHQR